MQPWRRPRRPGRPWQASGHHVPGVGQAVTACDQAPSGHACQAARGPPRAGAAAGCQERRAHTGDMGRVIGTILGAILAIWLVVTVAGGIFATLKMFVIIGLIAMAVFIVVWLLARRPSGG
jgi:predicted lipid-binding transport protein (Tim44 family)